MTAIRWTAGALTIVTALSLLTGCTDKSADAGDDAQKIAVSSGDEACAVSSTTAPSGRVQFDVENTGAETTEFYLYAEDGKQVIGEVENIGPGLSRTLVVTVETGSYVTACKPGQTGDGIRGEFTVTD